MISGSKEHKDYMLRKYHERRKLAYKHLGNKCHNCGSTSDKFEIDHIDPTKKAFSISKNWSVSLETFLAELNKCQLLCMDCHIAKTSLERAKGICKNGHSRFENTSLNRACKTCMREYSRDRRARTKTTKL